MNKKIIGNDGEQRVNDYLKKNGPDKDDEKGDRPIDNHPPKDGPEHKGEIA